MSKVIFFTGSGISVDSGVPTYRATDGLWAQYDLNEVCTIENFYKNFAMVHEFYNKRRAELEKVEPNHAHDVIAELAKEYDVILMTQNVDNLHDRTGVKTNHIHGELTKMKCLDCDHYWDIGYKAWDIEKDTCPNCGKAEHVKPGVIMFGEIAPMYNFLSDVLHALSPDDIFVVIGTSGQVVPIDYYLLSKPGYKILNNMGPREPIEYDVDNNPIAMNNFDVWDKILFESSTTGIDKIKKIIDDKLETK